MGEFDTLNDPCNTHNDVNHIQVNEARDYDPNDVAKHYTKCNRIVLLILYAYAVMSASALYYNWPSITRLLVRAGIYEWHCTAEELAAVADPGTVRCEAQRLNLAHLFVVTRGCDMLLSAITGYIVECYSQRVTLLFGEVCSFLAWLILACGVTNDTWAMISFCLIGLCASCTFMSTLNIIHLFPNNRGIAICLIISTADDLSIGVPMFLNKLFTLFGENNFQFVCLSYLIFAAVPSILIACFAMPFTSWIHCIEEYKIRFCTPDVEKQNNSCKPLSCLDASCASDTKIYNFKSVGNKLKQVFRPTMKYVSTWEYLCSIICFMITNFSLIFYQNLFLKYHEKNGTLLFTFEMLLGASFFPSMIVGYFLDYHGLENVNYVLQICLILAYVFLGFKTTIFGYIAAATLTIAYGVDYSIMLAYISFIFPEEHFTTLIGVSVFIDGIMAFVLSPLDHLMLTANGSWPVIAMLAVLYIRFFLYMFLNVTISRKQQLFTEHALRESDQQDFTLRCCLSDCSVSVSTTEQCLCDTNSQCSSMLTSILI